MLSLAPISSTAISSLEDSATGALSATGEIAGEFDIESFDAFADFMASRSEKVVAAEITVKEIGALESEAYEVYHATHAFITGSSATPADTPFSNRLRNGVKVTKTLSIGTHGFGQVSISWGTLEYNNADHELDTLVEDNVIDGRDVLLMIGETIGGGDVAPYTEFYPAFMGTSVKWHNAGDTITHDVRDYAKRLEVPSQPNVYSGTGGMNGGPELANKRIPRTFGYCKNVRPDNVIPAESIMKWNDGPSQAVLRCESRGYPLDFYADYSSVDLLRTSAPVAGQYATCLAESCIKIGGFFTEIRLDVQGDKTGGTYRTTVADILKQIITTATDMTTANIDDTAYAALNASQPAVVGYHLPSDSNETVAQTASKLLAGVGAFGYFVLDQHVVRRFEAPSSIAPVEYLTEATTIDVKLDRLPDSISPPPRRQRAIYGRNWHPLTDIVGFVSETDPNRAAYLSSPHQVATTAAALEAAVLIDHPEAPDPEPIESHFDTLADAAEEAERVHALYSGNLRLYEITVFNRTLVYELGQALHVTHSKHGLTAGKLLTITEIAEDFESKVTTVKAFG